ncbi:MAG: DUF2905 domain-containing protein [Bacteroidota bacterium]|nr:DUF2905 domain-containing protein [Bacteroidota bacterium]
MENTGKGIIILGCFILVLGLLLYYFGTYFKWLGNLPGDIRIERENFNFYFPITTMVIISIILSLIVKLFRHFWN